MHFLFSDHSPVQSLLECDTQVPFKMQIRNLLFLVVMVSQILKSISNDFDQEN